MARLARVPEMMPNEPLTTFLSRLASANGASCLRDFSVHMGIKLDRRIETDDLFGRLSLLTGFDAATIAAHHMRSEHHYVVFGGEHRLAMPSIHVASPRYCPECLAEDMAAGSAKRDIRPYTRFTWLVNSIEVCPKHRCNIVVSSTPYASGMRWDFCSFIRDSGREIEEAILSSCKCEVSQYDTYFSSRLSGGPVSNEILDPLPCFIAMRLCAIVGGMVSAVKGTGSHGVKFGATHPFRHLGFQILSSRTSLEAFLTDLGRTFVGNHHKKALGLYGDFAEYLKMNLSLPELQPLIEIVRDHAYATVPVGPGDGFLGGGGERRWHSLRTAEQETGVYFTVLRKILIERGSISPQELPKKDSQIMISVEDVAAAAADYHDRTSIEGVAAQVGLLHVTVRKLVRAGVLKPVYGTSNDMKAMFSRSALDGMIAGLTTGVEVRPQTDDLVPLRACTRGFGRDLFEIIGPLLEGRLMRVYLNADTSRVGFDRILLDKEEVRSFLVPTPPGLKRHEFARKLGLNHHTANDFFDSGHFKISRWKLDRSRKAYDIVDQESFDGFFREHDSLANFAKGTSPGKLKKALTAAGIEPVWACRERSIATFYRRSDIEWYRRHR